MERETRVLEVFLPLLFQPIQPGDRFAGRVAYPYVGISLEPGGLGYYCDIARILAQCNHRPNAAVQSMFEFWKGRTTRELIRESAPFEASKALPSDEWMTESRPAFPLYRIGGIVLDYEKLLSWGTAGLQQNTEESPLWSAPVQSLCAILRRVISTYVDQARQLGSTDIADSLLAIQNRPPASVRDAIQLLWIVALSSGTWNYGRLDDILGPYLQADLKDGSLTDESATDLVVALWDLISQYDNKWNNRVIVGGKGRKNPEAADAFARIAIEASRRVRRDQPQLSLRFYGGQDPDLLRRGLDSIAEGVTFPILYNDDVYVPAVSRAFRVTEEEAEQYLPYGCGETVLSHCSVSSPNGVMNLPLCLLIALFGGVHPQTGVAMGVMGSVPNSLDELWQRYCLEVDRGMEALAAYQRHIYDVTGTEAAFIVASVLGSDCVNRDKTLLAGGSRYVTACVETYGNTNVADSFAAIEHTRVSLDAMREAIRANWVGSEDLRHSLVSSPKYGNDDPNGDRWAVRVHEQACGSANRAGERIGWDRHHIVIINNSVNVLFGQLTPATPDGRSSGDTFANANNPAPGNDRNGVTAFINSLVKLDASLHAGAVQNMKFSPDLVKRRRPLFESLLDVYFAKGGAQAMITVVNRADLEAALLEPEKWGHLMVRVGGFSARFVDLAPDIQREILERTVHD